MRKKFPILLCFLFITLFLSSLKAQQTISDDSRKLSVEQRLFELEEGQKNINEQIDYLKVQMNNRFDDLTANFTWLYILLASIIVLNGVMVASVIWLALQDRPIGKRHYVQIIDQQNELEKQMRRLSDDVELIKTRLELT